MLREPGTAAKRAGVEAEDHLDAMSTNETGHAESRGMWEDAGHARLDAGPRALPAWCR
jgi:hypothetical protein